MHIPVSLRGTLVHNVGDLKNGLECQVSVEEITLMLGFCTMAAVVPTRKRLMLVYTPVMTKFWKRRRCSPYFALVATLRDTGKY